MKKVLLMLIMASVLLFGCGQKTEEEAKAPDSNTKTTEAAGKLTDDIAGVNDEEYVEEVEDTFVESAETKEHIETILQQEKEKAEAREKLGEVLTKEEYTYPNGTLALQAEVNGETGKKLISFKFDVKSGSDYEVAYNAINQFAVALLDSDFETYTELKNGNDVYIADMKSKDKISYSATVGGKNSTDKSSMPAIKNFDDYGEAEKTLITNIRKDIFVFLQMV